MVAARVVVVLVFGKAFKNRGIASRVRASIEQTKWKHVKIEHAFGDHVASGYVHSGARLLFET